MHKEISSGCKKRFYLFIFEVLSIAGTLLRRPDLVWKDPACSLYNHLEEAPEIIYYDFACSLEEYCINHEVGYFKNTQFFYDIFHGYNYTCSNIYNSKNLIHLNSVNPSICEQFNSYLQCIKSSAKQMSQEHFMFFLQCMIGLWNEKKKNSFMKKLNIALSGSLQIFCSDNSLIQRIRSWNLQSLKFFRSLSFPQDNFESMLKTVLFTFIAFCHDLQQILIKAG